MTQAEREKFGQLQQQVLPFDFWEDERKQAENELKNRVAALPCFDSPKNQKELYFNAQRKYYLEGDGNALEQMCRLIEGASIKIVRKITFDKKLYFSPEKLKDFADRASFYFVEQILKNNLVIKDSFIAYLYLQCNKAIFGMSLSEMFEVYLTKNHIDFMELSEEEKQKIRYDFEDYAGLEHKVYEEQDEESQPTLWSYEELKEVYK